MNPGPDTATTDLGRVPDRGLVRDLFAWLAPRYDAAVATYSWGQDLRWKHTLLRRLGPRPGQRALDSRLRDRVDLGASRAGPGRGFGDRPGHEPGHARTLSSPGRRPTIRPGGLGVATVPIPELRPRDRRLPVQVRSSGSPLCRRSDECSDPGVGSAATISPAPWCTHRPGGCTPSTSGTCCHGWVDVATKRGMTGSDCSPSFLILRPAPAGRTVSAGPSETRASTMSSSSHRSAGPSRGSGPGPPEPIRSAVRRRGARHSTSEGPAPGASEAV